MSTLRPLIAFGLVTMLAAAAEARGPSTKEEREKAVRLVRLLESDPLSKGAKDARAWLIVWLAEVPDITVEMCLALLGPTFESDREYGAELTVQQALSAAAFIIEHPDQAEEKLAVHVAGVEGVLRTYESILREHPKARFEALDALVKERESGSLKARVAELAKSCK